LTINAPITELVAFKSVVFINANRKLRGLKL